MVNLKTIPGLNGIHYGDDLRMGGLFTLAEIEEHPILLRRFPMIARAASLIGTQQLRNMGTLAGNLCQPPRCWYYRNSSFPCWLKGGKMCFVLQGENPYHALLRVSPCHAVHPSDLAPAWVALDSKVKISGPNGRRWVPLEDLYTKPDKNHRQMTILKRNELITEIQIALPPRDAKAIYLKAMDRRAWSFAIVSVAVYLILKRNRISTFRLVLGGVAPIPWRVKEVEELLKGKRLSEDWIRSSAEVALKDAQPLKDNGYKVPLAKALIQQALVSLMDRR